MHLIEILLPLSDNGGRPFAAELYGRVREELLRRFGGLTAFTRNPAEGLWEQDGERSHDDIVVFEVITDMLDRSWWGKYRAELEKLFEQDVIVVRAREVEQL